MNFAGYILPLPYQNLGQFYLNKHLNFPPQGYGHTWFKNRPLPLKKKLKNLLHDALLSGWLVFTLTTRFLNSLLLKTTQLIDGNCKGIILNLITSKLTGIPKI